MRRHLAIGDIHGCFRALTTLVEFVGVHSDDTLITLGDHVNRGPDSNAVLDWLIQYQRTGRLIALRGNHEVMMQQARRGGQAFERWMGSGGDRTLQSYSVDGPDEAALDAIPEEHWTFMDQFLRPSFEIDDFMFVHANVDPHVPLAEQSDEVLYWRSFAEAEPHRSGKTMICGHSSQKSGMPVNRGYAVCIDTWACGRGWLTCLCVESGELWQANEAGETRRLKLSDCNRENTR